MKIISIFMFLLVLSASSLALSSRAQALELLMLEQEICEWCERWHADIGEIYPKTVEGQKAPLVRLDIHEKFPEKYKNVTKGNFTPTFVLWDEGRELGRIRGYPGEDFFWALLGEMFKKSGKSRPVGTIN